MTKLKTTTQLMGILLASMLVIGCGKENKKAEETKKLVSEQKKLVEDFKQKYKLTPEYAKEFEEGLAVFKSDVQQFNQQIQTFKALEFSIEMLDQADKMTDMRKKQDFLKGFNEGILSKSPGHKTATTIDEAKIITLDAFNEGVGREGFQLKDWDEFRSFVSDSKSILENIKKQVELKGKNSKDKKPKDKS